MLTSWFHEGERIRVNKDACITIPDVPLGPTKEMSSHLRTRLQPIVMSAKALGGQPGMDSFIKMGQFVVYFENKYSQPIQQTTSTVLNGDTDIKTKTILLANQAAGHHAKMSKMSKTPFAYVLIAHRDKSSTCESLSAACKEPSSDPKLKEFSNQKFPIIAYDRERLMKRYGPTFKHLCSFVLTYSERTYQPVSE